jgi:5'-nucleotidase
MTTQGQQRFEANSLTLTILTTSDLHSSYFPKHNTYNYSGPQPCGGLGQRVTLLKQLRSRYPHLLLFDCGDSCAGTIFYEEYYGETDVLLFQLLDYTAISLGNHDAEKGKDNLFKQMQKISDKIPILCSNLIDNSTSQLLFQDFHLVILENNFKVGIFGILGSGAFHCMEPDFQQQVTFLSLQEVYQRVGQHLKLTEQCDLVICLSHSGDVEDSELTQLPFVDILYGGHTHKTYKEEAVVIPNGLLNGIGGTIWHQPPALGSAFSRTEVSLHKPTLTTPATLELLSSGLEWVDPSTIPEDKEIMEWLNLNYADRLQDKLEKGLARCEVDWLVRDAEKMTKGNSLLGKFIAHFVADTMGTPIGLVNRGGIKTGFQHGELITYSKAAEVLGNNNRIMSIEIKGILLTSLLHTVLPTGEYQFYGLEYNSPPSPSMESTSATAPVSETDPSVEIPPRGNLQVNGEEVLEHEWYQISMVDYMWKLALLRRERYFPDFDDTVHGDIHDMYRVISSRSLYWQEDFAGHLEKIGILSLETLLHLHDTPISDDSCSIGDNLLN